MKVADGLPYEYLQSIFKTWKQTIITYVHQCADVYKFLFLSSLFYIL
jgi:hypothetical protein